MATDCNYVYVNLISAEGAVVVWVEEIEGPFEKSHVVRHVLGDGQELKKTKLGRGKSNPKNAVRMKEKRKDPEYRRRENGRQREEKRT